MRLSDALIRQSLWPLTLHGSIYYYYEKQLGPKPATRLNKFLHYQIIDYVAVCEGSKYILCTARQIYLRKRLRAWSLISKRQRREKVMCQLLIFNKHKLPTDICKIIYRLSQIG